eukprot:403367980
MMQQTQPTNETYKKIQQLGKGSYGVAYLVKCESDQSLAVIKQIDISKISEEEKLKQLREAKILEILNHPNIIRFKEVYKTKAGKLHIVMDYADGGDLLQRIDQQKKKGVLFKENHILDWFTQMCLAIKHVHDRKILHRDLKGQNIFLTSDNQIKLGDFGIARVLQETLDVAKSMVGTPYYLSPEIIESKPYSFKSDIWALGVLLYEMCALKPPFMSQGIHLLAIKIVKGEYQPLPDQFSRELCSLVDSMLKQDPAQRPDIHQILKHPQLKSRIRKFLNDEEYETEFEEDFLQEQQTKALQENKRVSKLDQSLRQIDFIRKSYSQQSSHESLQSSQISSQKINEEAKTHINDYKNPFSIPQKQIIQVDQVPKFLFNNNESKGKVLNKNDQSQIDLRNLEYETRLKEERLKSMMADIKKKQEYMKNQGVKSNISSSQNSSQSSLQSSQLKHPNAVQDLKQQKSNNRMQSARTNQPNHSKHSHQIQYQQSDLVNKNQNHKELDESPIKKQKSERIFHNLPTSSSHLTQSNNRHDQAQDNIYELVENTANQINQILSRHQSEATFQNSSQQSRSNEKLMNKQQKQRINENDFSVLELSKSKMDQDDSPQLEQDTFIGDEERDNGTIQQQKQQETMRKFDLGQELNIASLNDDDEEQLKIKNQEQKIQEEDSSKQLMQQIMINKYGEKYYHKAIEIITKFLNPENTNQNNQNNQDQQENDIYNFEVQQLITKEIIETFRDNQELTQNVDEQTCFEFISEYYVYLQL